MGMISDILALVAFTFAIILLQRNRSDRRQLQEHQERLNDLQDRMAHLGRPVPKSPESRPAHERQPISEKTPHQEVPPPLPMLKPKSEPSEQPSAPTPPLIVPNLPGNRMPSLEYPIEPLRQDVSQPSQPISKEDRLGQLEKTLGLRWTTWVGGVVLFLGAGLFVKYAFEQRWLGPVPRVILGILAGIAVGGLGERFLRRQMIALGQGLIGVGLAIVYVSLFGAYALYHVLPQTVTFGLMVCVTVLGMSIAILRNAVAISFLALLGGFLTPLLLGSGQDSRDLLFAYVGLLDIGVLAVAVFKRWRLLDVLAFVGTYLLFSLWYFHFHNTPSFKILPTMLWLAAFYGVFLFDPFVYHLRQRTVITGERFVLAITNAIALFSWAFTILHPQHKHILGFITLVMSLIYLALGWAVRQRIPQDTRASLGFAAIFLTLLMLVPPIHLDLYAVTIAWAIQAPLLLYLAYKYDYLPIRLGSLCPFVLAVVRLFMFPWPWHEGRFIPLLNASFGTALLVVAAGCSYTLIHHRHRQQAHVLDHPFKLAIGIGSGFLLLVSLHLDIWQWLTSISYGASTYWACALIWSMGCVGFAIAGTRGQCRPVFVGSGISLSVAILLCMVDYFEGDASTYFMLNGRFLVAAVTVVLLLGLGRLYQHPACQSWRPQAQAAEICYGLGALGLSLLLYQECHLWLPSHGLAYLARSIYPLTWLCGGWVAVLLGHHYHLGRLRLSGLAFIALAAIAAIASYLMDTSTRGLLFLNARFLASLTVVSCIFAYGFAVKPNWREGLWFTGSFALSLLLFQECLLWLPHHGYRDIAYGVYPLTWILGGTLAVGLGHRFQFERLRLSGILFLALAGSHVIMAYVTHLAVAMLFVNLRFIVSVSVALAVLGYGIYLKQSQTTPPLQTSSLVTGVFTAGTIGLFLVLNAEIYCVLSQIITDKESTRWVTQMALSILWSLYATVLLIIGFWRRVRVLRLAALALFGGTALKLVLFDLAGAEEIYRIVSFIGLGLLMIAASYLYHRVEKKLSPERGG